MHKKKNTILVVDDEAHVRKMLGIVLDDENLKIVECDNGQQAIRLCVSIKPDLILLDLGLPDMDGKEVIVAIREWSHVPIIVLSGRLSDEEVVAALNLGANDYITKPFNVDVLLARINVSLRSSAVHEVGEPELHNGPLRMDLVRHEVYFNDKLVGLTPKEYDLLRHFMINRGKMLTHKEILKKVWGASHDEDTTYLRVYIGQIRKKIEEYAIIPVFIVTEPGIGYRMETIPIEIEDEYLEKKKA
ncbi:MAG: response regulator transcription factor [Alphaproteobacteria bacterium]|nr:response regulator transcription factor [Alphaproteobacteria bacterium]